MKKVEQKTLNGEKEHTSTAIRKENLFSRKKTKTKESSTRKKVDIWLSNLGWNTDEESPYCNVTTERAINEEQNRLISPNEPDYILYKSNTVEPIGIIETKRKGKTLDQALDEAIKKYAKPLDIPIILITDGTFVKSWHLTAEKELTIDGISVNELFTEKQILRFIYEGADLLSGTKAIKHTRDQLMDVFKWANIVLRKEGIREGFDRFIEFANLLFLKLISEMEIDRESHGETRIIEQKYCWNAFKKLDAETMLEYLNGTVLPYLSAKYNHSGDVFQKELQIKNPQALKQIVDRLTGLEGLINTESDIKGDAFEYFIKNSVTVGNDLGEYFTPRHIVKLMVDIINPQFGEKIYDPTCGTGGFLIQSFNHIKRTCKLTESNLKILREETVYGREFTNTSRIAKMNMIITGDGHTNITQIDSLAYPVREQYDVVLANPPYAQTTDHGDLYPVPSIQADPVFLEHIMLGLKDGGRAAVIVPEGVLYRKGSDRKVRELLLSKYNLVAVFSLPVDAFVPYASAKTYILIFYKGGTTKRIWFFNVENDGFSLDTKRVPIKNNDIPLLKSLWEDKCDSEKSWSTTNDEIVANDFNLSPMIYRPQYAPTKGISKEDANACLEELRNILSKANSIVNQLRIKEILTKSKNVPLYEVLEEVKRPISVKTNETYKIIGVRWYGKGVFIKEEKEGAKIKAKKLNMVKSGDFIYSKLFAWMGSFDIVENEFDGCFASNEFPTFRLKNKWKVDSRFVKYYFKIPSSWKLAEQKSLGTAKISRNRLKVPAFLNLRIPIPEPKDMKEIIDLLSTIEDISIKLKKSENMAENLLSGTIAQIFERMK